MIIKIGDKVRVEIGNLQIVQLITGLEVTNDPYAKSGSPVTELNTDKTPNFVMLLERNFAYSWQLRSVIIQAWEAPVPKQGELL